MTKFELKTPVVLIIFNRPETTEKVFEVIREAQPPQLFVIADAPRPNKPGEAEKCMAARGIINQVDWECEVLTNYAEINLGCRERVSSGLNWVFSLVESAIILEDDCVAHPSFFRFCEELLERYRNDDRIMTISGDNLQFGNNPTEYSYYFSRYPHCWGWATWRRAWQYYDNQMKLWSKLRDSNWLENILQNAQAVRYWSEIFQNNYQGFNSWAYAWLFAGWSQNGLTILPKVNLVSNIGFGREATHTSSVNRFANMPVSEMFFPLKHPTSISRNIQADDFTEKTMFSGSLSEPCKICGAASYYFDNAKILEKYNVNYFQCSNCGFVQTENPYWLTEAYAEAIAGSDVGLVSRNQNFSLITERLILNFFNADGKFLDYGCGYGLFVRMMRDLGLDFYGYDKHCQNIFSQGWEGEINREQKYEIATAFEVFEHFINPLAEIEKILQQTRNILFSTQLLPPNNPRPNDWWYYALEEGQHISIFTKKALFVIAKIFKLNLYSDGESLHLLTEKRLSNSEFYSIFRVGKYKPENRKESLTQLDYKKATEKKQKDRQQLDLKVLIDGVFFQIHNTGIARVWKSLLEVWAKDGFAQYILVLDRGETAPKIPGIKYRVVPRYNDKKTDADRQMLQQICDQEKAGIFISTYYTTPILTPSIFMAYDMIPELLGENLDDCSWQEKHRSIRQAVSYIAISENTARDLVKYFPQIPSNSITVAPCGLDPNFSRATPQEVTNFQSKYHIDNPYFLIVGERIGWLGYKNTILFFQAFARLKNSEEFEIVCIGGNPVLEPELSKYISGNKIHLLQLSDQELKLAYSGAIALIYPSKYEGFGMPIVEAMACGCPVITCKNASIPEVAATAALYINDNDVSGLINALGEVQKPEVRQRLITTGLAQAKKFSWWQMAKTVSNVFIQTFNRIKVERSPNPSQPLLSWNNFQDFTYSKRRHFNIFRRFGYYINLHPDAADLKFYQDILVYNFITQNLPPGSKLLEIGGGNSRIIEALKSGYECWNIDKLEGKGNGPNNIKNPNGYQLVLDYIGNFNTSLPNNYFDCVFSISTLEHLAEDEQIFKNVCDDINRVLKPNGISLHCLDIVIKKTFVWSKGILPYIFKNIQTLNQMIPFDKMQQDPDLYVMSELAYQRNWQSITKQSYTDFGKPVSYNILWQKQEKLVSPNVIVKQSLPKISIVTPSLNQGEFLAECIDSVLSQNYPHLEYIIMDGGSKDNSVEIIKKYEKYLSYWQSQSDGGHYSAINLGFSKTTGEIMAWLNSDDKYHPDAFFKVVAAFQKNQEIEWIMGRPTQWDKSGKLEYISQQLPPWSREGLLNNYWQKYNQWIQQESTFWQRSLWKKSGSRLSTEFKFAGDFELWMRFSRYTQLFVIDNLIGGFRYYENQRSQKFKNQYVGEVETIVDRELQLIGEGKFTNSQPAPKPVKITEAEINLIKHNQTLVIATSIAPGNQENQQAAILSWQKLGFTVVSLNNQQEINQLEAIYKNVTFYPVKRDAKAEVGRALIYLDDLLLYLKKYGTNICGIVNSDVRLEAGEDFLSFISEQAKNSVIFGSRVDIDSAELTEGEVYQKGFDIFFFDKKMLEQIPTSKFCLGLPWWDLWIPSIAIKKGLIGKYLATPVAYHVKHRINYSNNCWQTMGIHFAEIFNLDLSNKLQQMLLTNPTQLQLELTQLAHQTVRNIHQNTDKIQYQSQENKRIESISNQVNNQNMNNSNLTKIQGKYPPIHALSGSNHRPFFSVMIPTYKKVKYLEQTLKSVLQQALLPEEMQIEVVNDCPDVKIQAELEAIVRRVGGERINFYRHSPQDIGQAPIFNICLQRAQGYWVHLLHDDDFVLPGFYQNLRRGIEQNTTLGAAFCRHYYIDENNNQMMLSPLEKETPGIISHWLEKIAVMQRIQCASIVVKRSVYEQVGGFCLEANSAADWEMWKRIAAYYPVAYEPEPLACYRWHSTSESSRLIKFGGNIADTRKAIQISESYLPPEIATKLSNQAREHYAISATQMAQKMLSVGETTAAIAQIQEGLKCSQSSQVKEAVISLFITSDSTPKINTTQLLSEINNYVEQYQKDFSNQSVLNHLRQLRQQIANYWLNLPTEKLESAYLSDIGKAHQKLISSSLKYEQITDTEKSFVNQIETHIAQGLNQQNSIQYLLAATLYYYPHQLSPNWFEQAPIPKWFVNDYMKFMIDAPSYFQEIGEADNYYRYTLNWSNYLHQRICSNSDSKIWQDIAWFFTQKTNFIPLYFNSENLKEIYIKRAEIMEIALQSRGFKLDYIFPERPVNRNKIRLGVLSSHFIPQTETFSTLPFFEHLDKTKFEIILYTKNLTEYPLEKYCQSRAERLVKLPDNLMSQVETIRTDDLDILLIGTNITAITNPITLLALHRLARIQVTSTSSCVTTGMRHIDYYISGNLTEPKQEAQQQYREELITLKGAAHCFNYYATEPEKPVVKPGRESWGITDENIVFVSGANFYKIIPELRETWAKIIAAVPNSILVLYPFNPNWSNSYQAGTHFVNDMRSIFSKYGIDKKRLIVIKTLPSRSDIKECLKLCDVYLDSYPFAGVNSLIEPLEIGLPIITKDGNSFRSLMGSGLLRSLSIPDLITDNETAYIHLAIKLANNPEFRQQKRQEIQAKMQQNPPFLDSHAYGKEIGKLFQELFQKWQNIHTPKTIESTGENSLNPEFINRLVGCVNLYEIDPTDQSLIEELRQLRKQIADFWLDTPPKKLETIYQGKIRQAYQALLASGIQNEPQTEDEQKFLKELVDISLGLTNPKAVNALLGGMLYFPPGKMLVRDAKNRLPQWLINDYKQVFESREVAQKLEEAFKSQSPHLPEESTDRGLVTKPLQADEFKPEKNVVLTENKADNLETTQQKFLNQLFGSVNLYYIDPSDESVVKELRQVRKQMADFWINLEPKKLETFYLGEMGKGYKALLISGIQNQTLTDSEQTFLQELATQLAKGIEAPKAINYLLGAMLYCRQGQLQVQDSSKLPQWLEEDYYKFVSK